MAALAQMPEEPSLLANELNNVSWTFTQPDQTEAVRMPTFLYWYGSNESVS